MTIIYYIKTIQTKSEKGKAAWNEGRKKQAFTQSFPVDLHRTRLIAPASNCDNTCEMSTRTQDPGF